jgi:serine phosphatase RsbU (regulator of sigma subunit)
LYYPVNYVSGDSYHLEWRNDGRLLRGFLLDVSGHGLATAIQTASLNVLLHEIKSVKTPLLGQLRTINARAAKYFADGSYAAILGFELDLGLQELRYVGAGITQFYVNGRKIGAPGMFVGLWDDAEFISGTLPIAAGDCLYLLTDGFTDALAQPANAGRWSPDGKDFTSDVSFLQQLAESGALRDDASGVCLKIKALL